MRKAHQILAYVLAAMVVVQAMAIAYALAGLGHWIDKDGGMINKAVFDAWENNPPTWRGSGGFALHGIDGQMVIPLLSLILLVVSLLAAKEVPGAGKRGGILFGLVVLQVVLGMALHGVVLLAPLHALNAFGIFAMAYVTGKKAGVAEPVAA